MLGQRREQWTNIKVALFERLVFSWNVLIWLERFLHQYRHKL